MTYTNILVLLWKCCCTVLGYEFKLLPFFILRNIHIDNSFALCPSMSFNERILIWISLMFIIYSERFTESFKKNKTNISWCIICSFWQHWKITLNQIFKNHFNFITIVYQIYLNWIGREFTFNIHSMNNNSKLILHCLRNCSKYFTYIHLFNTHTVHLKKQFY